MTHFSHLHILPFNSESTYVLSLQDLLVPATASGLHVRLTLHHRDVKNRSHTMTDKAFREKQHKIICLERLLLMLHLPLYFPP